jgi:hypothetical protein
MPIKIGFWCTISEKQVLNGMWLNLMDMDPSNKKIKDILRNNQPIPIGTYCIVYIMIELVLWMLFGTINFVHMPHVLLKGSPIHVAPTCVGFREGSNPLDLMYTVFPCISAKGCFEYLNPWPHGQKAIALSLYQGSPSKVQPDAYSSRLRQVLGGILQLWVLYTQSFHTFLQEAIFKTLMTSWSQGNNFTAASDSPSK